MLRAVADCHGIALSNNVARAMAGELVEAIIRPGHLNHVIAGCSADAAEALDSLLREDGRLPVAPFERRFGSVRSIGPGRLERERSHLAPVNASEELWYLALIHRTVGETPDGLMEFMAVPDDLVLLLPEPQRQQRPFAVPAAAAPSKLSLADDMLLHDCCSILCLVQAGEVHLTGPVEAPAWHSTSLYALNELLLQPAPPESLADRSGPGSAGALALALAAETGWLRVAGRRMRLDATSVQQWLGGARSRQRRALMEVWSASEGWNDLCRTPALSCQETGSWSNDPLATRSRLLPLLATLSPDRWHGVDAFVAAVRDQFPDFQRPDGDYNTWYLRRRDDPVYLRGFESWDQVEGDLLRFLMVGPLNWLAVVENAASVSDETLFRLTGEGTAWLAGQEPVATIESGRPTVLSDYTVEIPADAPLLDRFRVSRFTTWLPAEREPSLRFRYRISQTGLQHAARQGITAQRVLEYLRERAGAELPENVAAALVGWQSGR